MSRPRWIERGLAAAVGLLLVAWCLREDVQPDLYFHLAAGRWILAHGFPRTNVFLAPHPDHAFVDHEWLFQALAWPLYGLGGPALLTLVKSLVVLATFAALWAACRPRVEPGARRGPASAVAVVLAAALVVAGSRFILRPEVFSFLGVAVHLWLLGRERGAGRRWPSGRTLIALPLLQVVWSNVHGFAVLGPVLVLVTLLGAGCHELAARWAPVGPGGRAGWWQALSAPIRDPVGGRPGRAGLLGLAALLVLELLASCVNPYGVEAALYPFLVLARAGQDTASAGLSYRVVELASPFGAELRGQPEIQLYLLWLALAPGLAAIALARRRARLEEIARGAALVATSVLYLRNLPFAALGLAPLTVAGLWALLDLGRDLPAALRARARTVSAAVALLGVLGLTRAVLLDRWHQNASYDARPGLGLGDFVRYDEAAGYLEQNPPRGALFNNFGAGHFLSFARGAARPLPYISGNTDLYPREHLARYHAIMRGEAPLLDELDRRGVSDVLLDHRLEVEDRVLRTLLEAPEWVLVHADLRALIFRRADALGPGVAPLDRDALARELRARSFRSEEPDRFPPTRALRALRLLAPRQLAPIDRLHAARLLDLLGRPQAALELAREAERLAPGWAPALQTLAALEEAHGSPTAARRRYERLAAVAPDDVLPRVKLGLLALRGGDTARAVRELQAASARDPSSRLALENLLAALEADQDPVELRRTLARAPSLDAVKRHYYLGAAALLEGDLERAEADLGRAVELDPELVPALARWAEVLGRLGRLAPAEAAWVRLCALTPDDASAWRALGQLRRARRDAEGALQALGQAARVAPSDPEPLVIAAEVLLERDRPDAARAHLEEALRRQPGHSRAGDMLRRLP